MARPRNLSTRAPDGHNYTARSLPLLCVDWVLFLVLLLPNILYAFYRRLFPGKWKSLDGKVVLVTGAGHDLGKELALQFAKEGCRVACVDLEARQNDVLETAAEIVRDGERAGAYAVNLSSVDEIKSLRESVTKDLGPVDILVNSLSLDYVQRLQDSPEDAVRAVVTVNLLSPIWMLKEFLPTMKERDSGHVVTVSSLHHLTNAAVYTATKAAVAGFTESLRLEVLDEGYRGIYFTTVLPRFMSETRGKSLGSQQLLTAARSVTAVKHNLVSVAVPETLYWLTALTRLLPTTVTDWLHELSGLGKLPVSKELEDSLEPVIKGMNK